MGIPRCARDCTEAEGMSFRQTMVIRKAFVDEGECPSRVGVPGICRNEIESDLYLPLQEVFSFRFVS